MIDFRVKLVAHLLDWKGQGKPRRINLARALGKYKLEFWEKKDVVD